MEKTLDFTTVIKCFFYQSIKKEEKGEKGMTADIYIDPKINLGGEGEVTIIIHFKTVPAKVAVSLAESGGAPLTLEKAELDVEASHVRFQEDVQKYLGQK